MASGGLISRIYSSFRGVDFRGEEINLVRSPDSLNVWRNYKKTEGIETRPGMELLSIVDEEGDKIFGEGTGNTINGIYFYNDIMILHCKHKLYSVVNGVATELNVWVSDTKSDAFIFNNLWYFKDGTHYLQYDGETFRHVYDVAHIPTTTIGRKAGAIGGGTLHEDVNMLSDYRKNTFVGDGERGNLVESSDFYLKGIPVGYSDFYLDVPEIDDVIFSPPTPPEDIDITTASGMLKYNEYLVELAGYLKEKMDFLCGITIDGKPIWEAYETDEGETDYRPVKHGEDRNGVPIYYDVLFSKDGYFVDLNGEKKYEDFIIKMDIIDGGACTVDIFYRGDAGTYPIRLAYKVDDGEYTELLETAEHELTSDIVDIDNWCGKESIIFLQDNLPDDILSVTWRLNIGEESRVFKMVDGAEVEDQVRYYGGNASLYTGNTVHNATVIADGTLDGKIRIYPAPPAPLTDGQDNVSILFKKGNADKLKINNCTLLQIFDNRVFFSGNPDYPNMMWHSSLNDPTYCSDLDNYNEGLDRAEVKGMVAGNNALWVFKEPSQANTTIFYHTPATDLEYGKIYPNAHSSISIGCTGKAINFNDDIVFFSDRGMEGISSDITTEQVISHRSSLVDSKLTAEPDYKDMLLEEWEGYLLVFIGNKVYLADSRAMFSNENHGEYEWFYWELEKEITCTRVDKGTLYLGTEDGLYSLTDTTSAIESYWVTPKDKFKHPQYLKTTNKRGCVVEATGDITISVKTEKTDFEDVGTFEKILDYFVCRIKRKKWKDIQLKFSSNTRFSLETATLEAFIGGYTKR